MSGQNLTVAHEYKLPVLIDGKVERHELANGRVLCHSAPGPIDFTEHEGRAPQLAIEGPDHPG